MNTPATDRARLPRQRVAPWIAAALLALAPVGALVSQETPQPATPADTQPATKKPQAPASKTAGDATKPADATKAPASTAKPASGSGGKAAGEAGKPATPEGEKPEKSDDLDKAKAPTIFVPSQKTSADNSATFPIDI
jgi:hypothetical protein